MALDGGSTEKQPQQLITGKKKPGKSSTDLRNSPGSPLNKLPKPRSEQKKLNYNAPLLSIRRLNNRHPATNSSIALLDNPGHSQLNKQSAELNCESLHVPRTVPFVWELAPGRRKVSDDSQNADGSVLQPCSADADDMNKKLPGNSKSMRSLRSLFRNNSIEPGFSEHLSSHAVTASNTRFSVAPSADDDEEEDNASSNAAFTAATDAFTTACGLSNDDFDGGATDTQTNNDDRSFIMYRFLPAAHAIAHDSPQTPSQRSPAAHSPAPLVVNRPWRSGPLRYQISNSSAPIRTPATHFLQLSRKTHRETDDEARFTTCGRFSFRFFKIFLSLHRDLRWFKHQRRSKDREPSRPSRFGSALYQDESSDDDQDIVSRQVQKDVQNKRAHKMMERVNTSVAANGSSLHELMRVGEAETLHDSVSQSRVFNPGKSGAVMSLFVEGQGFLGLPQERHLNDVGSETDGSASNYQTPQRSMSTSKLAEIDAYRNEHESSSRIASFLSRLHKPANPEERDLEREVRPPCVETEMIPPGNASTLPNCSPNSTLQRPDNRQNGEIFAPEKKPRPTLPSRRRPSSPSRFSEAKKKPETYFSAPLLSPPLPKSPSDSWLWKAIPVKARKLPPLPETEKIAPSDYFEPSATWEDLVKESRFQARCLRSFEERSYHATKVG